MKALDLVLYMCILLCRSVHFVTFKNANDAPNETDDLGWFKMPLGMGLDDF